MSSYIARNSISGTRLTPQNETGFLAAPGRESGQETSRQILPVVPEMASIERPSVNLYEPRAVSREGFRIEDAARVAIENCLNKGVHPNPAVVEFVTVKAPKSHKGQQGRGR